MITVSNENGKCNQLLSIIVGSYTCSFYSTINFESNHCDSSLHLNIINDHDVSSAILDITRDLERERERQTDRDVERKLTVNKIPRELTANVFCKFFFKLFY